MIKEKLYSYSAIDYADFDFNLCEEKEKFLKSLEKSTPKFVEKFHTKGTNSHLKYDNVASQFTLCINRAELCTTDYCDFSLWDFITFLGHLAYYDDKPLMCAFHDEGCYSLLLAIPYDENQLRISVFNRPEYNNYKCAADIIIKKDTFLSQIKDVLVKTIKDTEKMDKGHENRYVDGIKSGLEVLEKYFNNLRDFKKTYDVPKNFRVFDIAYKNLDGIWEFYACLDDDEKADPDYWEKQKQEGKILDYDYEEQYSHTFWSWDKDYKKRIRLTKEDIRKNIKTQMDNRVEEKNWVYSTETQKWYATNETMDMPKKDSYHIQSFYTFELEPEVKSKEDYEIEIYLLDADKDDEYLGFLVYNLKILDCNSKAVVNIEFDYRYHKRIKEALKKVQNGEYVRFLIHSYGAGKMHIWEQKYANEEKNEDITVAIYEESSDYKKDKELYYFTINRERFVREFLSALDTIEHKINVIKYVLEKGKELDIEKKFNPNDKCEGEFKYIESFVGDYTCVHKDSSDGWGILDKDLKWVIKPESVIIWGETHPKYGREILGVHKKYTYLHNIDGKLFIAAKRDGKRFVMDIDEKLIIPHVSDEIYYTYLNDELFFAAVDYNKTCIVNSKGEDVLTLDFAIGKTFWLLDDIIIISKDDKFGIIDWKGSEIFDFIFSDININPKNPDFIPVKYMNNWGFITKTGEVIDFTGLDENIQR